MARPFVRFLAQCEAIYRAGSTNREAIRAALRKTSTPGEKLITPWRGNKFNETGQNILGDAIIIQCQEGVKPHTLYPVNLATRKVFSPFPSGQNDNS